MHWMRTLEHPGDTRQKWQELSPGGAAGCRDMPLPCTQVSKVLVHVWIGTSVVMGIVWICGDATLEVTDKCTGCDPSTAGSSGCSCTTMKGLGGFTTDGAYDASLSDNPYGATNAAARCSIPPH
jgi:hypothetical protein